MNTTVSPASCVKANLGFTLVEMLVVIAIMGILGAASVSVLTSVMSSANLSAGGQLIVSQISLARQEAVTRNEQVEVLFYNLPRGSSSTWCGIQIESIQQTSSGTVASAVTRLVTLPDGVMISGTTSLSPLLTADPSISGTTVLPNHGTVSYKGFSFRPNGSTDYGITTANNILTVQNVSGGTSPKNYFTLQINPVGGKISIFRP